MSRIAMGLRSVLTILGDEEWHRFIDGELNLASPTDGMLEVVQFFRQQAWKTDVLVEDQNPLAEMHVEMWLQRTRLMAENAIPQSGVVSVETGDIVSHCQLFGIETVIHNDPKVVAACHTAAIQAVCFGSVKCPDAAALLNLFQAEQPRQRRRRA